MGIDVPWPILKTEFGLIALTLFLLVLDIFLPKEKRGTLLANIAMIGVTALFAQLPMEWGNFGTGFMGTYVQDGVSVCFKGLFLLAGFFTLFMAREYQGQLRRGKGELILLILFALIGMLFLVFFIPDGVILLFSFLIALATLSISWRKLDPNTQKGVVILASCFLFWFLEHLFLFPDRKYRYPLEPLMMIFAAFFWTRLSRKQPKYGKN